MNKKQKNRERKESERKKRERVTFADIAPEGGHYRIPKAALRLPVDDLTIDAARLTGRQTESEDGGDASDSLGGNAAPFRGRVNSGGVILNHPWWGNFAIDMDGLSIPRQDQPVLRDHDASKVLGVTKKIEVNEARELVAEGEVFDVTNDGKEVIDLTKMGVPFQMSCYVPPSAILRVEQGESVEVNGHTLEGPGHVFTKSELREVTVTPLGADANTEFALLSRADLEASTECDAVALTVSTLSETKTETMDDPNDEAGTEAGKFSQEDIDAAAKRAREAERDRLAAIDEHAADTGYPPEKLAQLKASDKTAEECALVIFAFTKAQKKGELDALETTTPKSTNDPESFAEGKKKKRQETDAELEAMPLG